MASGIELRSRAEMLGVSTTGTSSSRWFVALWWSLVAIAGLDSATAGGIVPDHFTAVQFGREIERDFRIRHSRALVERIDGDAMRSRVFRAKEGESFDYSAVWRDWQRVLMPGMSRQLEVHESIRDLYVVRVSAIAGERVLECLIMKNHDRYLLVNLILGQGKQGAIHIRDFHFSTMFLESARSTRHNLLLSGTAMPGRLDDEEGVLAAIGRTHGPAIAKAMNLLAQGSVKTAADQWLALPQAVRETRAWRDLRSCMALIGSEAALQALREAATEKESMTPMLRLSLASTNKLAMEPLDVIDDARVAHQDLSWLRVMKTGYLINKGKTEEALSLARTTCELSPTSPAAHSALVCATVAAGRADVVPELLAQWLAISSLAEIERALSIVPESGMRDFLSSPRYSRWRDEVEKNSAKPGVTGN